MQIYRVETQRIIRTIGNERGNTSVKNTKTLLLPYKKFQMIVCVHCCEEIEPIKRGCTKRKHHRFREGKC
jgi:hypothetical protein